MGFHVHRSERTDALLQGLAGLMTEIPGDPLTPEIVAVPTPGIERFITQGLGTILGTSGDGQDGVCANVDFPSPAAVVNRVISQATGIDPRTDPWLAQRAVWPLLSVIDRSAGEAWCEPLARHLGLDDADPHRRDRRFAVASGLASLFSTYASQRPQMLLDWADGEGSDGAGAPVPDDLTWQPILWRALRDEIGTPSLAERMANACAIVRSEPHIVDLPERLSVFGASRLPADQLQILSALGDKREVHLWLADASPALWRELGEGESTRRREDTSATYVANPLLHSLGRDSRELRIRLAQQALETDNQHLPSDLAADTLLSHLQRQLRDNKDPRTQTTVSPDDGSIQVHACHGQTRQAEVIREVILGLLQDDPTLEPRDILIMCPDLDAFAPLLSAAFSTPDSSGTLRLRIADRTPEQSNAVLTALAALLELVTGRLELSALLDFAAQPPVSTRFGFDEDALERLEDLTAQAGIRWGLNDAHRDEFHVRVSAGTWAWGIDRLLLGAAMSEDGLALVNHVLPVDDVNSGDVELVGRLAELVTRLKRARETIQGQHPVQEWVRILSDALTDLTDNRGADAWQLPNALGAIATLADNAASYADAVPLSLADIRWQLAEVLAGRPTRSNFRSGDLTMCGLVPMRSVPHRVICLVGMDDGAFPRIGRSDGDDVLALDPLIGERDLRSEDRQLLLDAIMAATDHLVITYTGADERTNAPQPPCVPLGDLLDTLDAMAGGTARDHVCVNHPLQPFDARNFTPAALGTDGPFSHDRSALAAARRAAEPRQPAPSMHLTSLPAVPLAELSPQDLGSFLCSPPATFLRARFGLSLREDDEPTPERIPVAMDGLAKWEIGNRTLRLLIKGESEIDIAAAETARGDLPPGAIGKGILDKIREEAGKVAARFAAVKSGDPRQVNVSLDLPGPVRLVGALADVFEDGIVRATYSKSKPRDALRLWPEVLALAAARPDRRWSACMLTQDGGVRLMAPPAEHALRILTELVDLYRAGIVSPLPLPAATAYEYAKARSEDSDPAESLYIANRWAWEGQYGDAAQGEVVRLWGADQPIEVLLDEKPRPDENWFDEITRFGMLSRRLWEPILQVRENP